MSLFHDYESAGPGISKHAPKKKGISLFFDILFRKMWQLMGINMLYLLFFVPLLLIFPVIYYTGESAALPLTLLLILVFSIIIGPATAGMTKIMRMYIIEKHTFVVRDFFKGFRDNFKKAAVIGFLDCLIIFSVIAGFRVYPQIAAAYNNKLLLAPMVIMCSIAIVVFMMNFYIWLMLIATDLSLKNLFKNSFALAFVGMKHNLISIGVIVLTLFIMLIMMIYVQSVFFLLMLILPWAFLSFVICFNCYPVIQRFVINPYYESIGQINPELMSPEDEEGEEPVFEDMGGKEQPIEKRRKGKGRRIS